jgi:predicted alpha/beta hydrolase
MLPGAEEITFETADSLHLGGWFAPTAATGPKATVLVFNGNAGDRSFRAPLAAALNQAGFSVLLFDYRGYGKNPGSPSEQGLVIDARAAWAYLAAR